MNSVLLVTIVSIVILLSAICLIRPLRQQLITRPIFSGFKAVLPPMSSTEREALEAGDVWWEAELFAGKPNWKRFSQLTPPTLTEEEQRFLDHETEQLCAMLDEWEITHERNDLPPTVWQFIRDKGFFSLIIPKEFGGKAFSPYAQSCIVTKIATQSINAAVTVMVPNSLGPGELLMHYGTPEQQQRWLPGLAAGKEIPCFGLTSPEAGSDAGAIPDFGTVCMGTHGGKHQLGIRLNFAKRWITLAPVATVVGLAFKLRDPDGLLGDSEKVDYDITCALIPANHPGVEIGRRHYPGAFMNGPINGKDVFIPIDWIIGGRDNAGKGWRMLMECLSVGRGISLPALGAAASKVSYQTTGAYSRIRRQFNTSIGQFEGVKEATARIAGLSYTLEAMRQMVCSGLEECSPPVVSAIAKYHMTEMMRTVMNDAMDVHGGRAIQLGPRNYLAAAYQAIPIAITVEGANILTRSLMIFGQGAVRCHPYVFDEMEAARNPDNKQGLRDFDRVFWRHIGYSIARTVRAFGLGLSAARLSKTADFSNQKGFKRHYQRINQLSASLAFTADLAMALLGGDLKRRELLSARLGDMLSQLFIATAVLRHHAHAKAQGETNDQHAEWAVNHALFQAQEAFIAFCDNFPKAIIGRIIKRIGLPLGSFAKAPNDELTNRVGNSIMQATPVRDEVSFPAYITENRNDARGRVEHTFRNLLAAEPTYLRVLAAVRRGDLNGENFDTQLKQALAADLITADEALQLSHYDRVRQDCLLTDAFDPAAISGRRQLPSSAQSRPMPRAEQAA